MYIFSILLILLILVFVIAFFVLKKGKKLSSSQISNLKKILKKTFINNNTSTQKIIEADKLYHKVLKDLWYEWSFSEILKKNPKEIRDIQKIWELHKLRNKLAHDFDLITESVLKKKVLEFKKEIEVIIKKVS